MKILFIHHRYHTNLFNWFRGFQENGHQVKLLVYKSDEVNQPDLPRSEHLPPSKWSVRKMKKNPRTRGDGVDSFSPYYYPSVKTLYRYFKQETPEVVVIRPAFSRFGYLVLLMALWFRCKIVFHSRIRIHRHYPAHKLMAFKLFLGLLNAHWMSPCKGDPKKYPSASKRLIYLPFLIRPQVDENRSYFKDGKVNILCVAKYFKSKNPKMMLEVFLKLREKFDDIQLTICGTGDPEGDYFLDMKNSVHTSKYKNDISLFINQPLQQMSALYQDHDIFVLPTRHDPASFTVLEAMSYGMATMTTDIDGSSGYIHPGVNGFVFKRDDQISLFSILSDYLESQQKIQLHGLASLNQIQQAHQPKIQTEVFLKQIK